jgi:hypothetical protein
MADYWLPTKNSKYYISKQKYLTARHFCLQYSEWLDEYNALSSGSISGINYDGMPHGSGSGNPTEAKAIRMAELSSKIEMVEQTAIEAGGEIAEWILKGVTIESATFNYLKMVTGIPCERDMYYERRRKFYWLISQKI